MLKLPRTQSTESPKIVHFDKKLYNSFISCINKLLHNKNTYIKLYFFTICSVNLLVNGKLIVILEKNPSGGYRTNGIDSDGLTTKVVPGGRASRPSDVIDH